MRLTELSAQLCPADLPQTTEAGICMVRAENTSDQLSDYPLNSGLHHSRILIVDDEAIIREILVRQLESLGYECECCTNGRTAISRLANGQFDLMLADALAPDIGGVELLKAAMKASPGIAVILVTSVIDIEAAVDALKDGAYDYIPKPFSPEQVSISVARALEKRHLLLENRNYQRTLVKQVASRTRQLEQALEVLHKTYHSTLEALSKALDSRDAGSDGRSLRVTVYAKELAERLGLDPPNVRVIEQGVLLHDFGKIGIPDELLSRPRELTEKEQLLLRQHPEIGYRILSSIKFLKNAAQIVLHHHERYDGKGYPRGLKGEQIHIGARIFAIADALDDLTSNPGSGARKSFEVAIQEIKKMSGSQLDPQIVARFLRVPISKWEELHRKTVDKTERTDFMRAGGTQAREKSEKSKNRRCS
jgi:putative nucleotidyltransferase with HDIG domain